MKFLITIIACAAASVAGAAPPQPTIIGGNGGLTFGVGSAGQILVCRWPSPGAANQVSCAGRVIDGAMWGVQSDSGSMQWLNQPRERTTQAYDEQWPLIRTTTVLPDGATVVQEIFAHPERDIIVASITMSGANKPANVCWYANFTPRTRVLTELPVQDWIPDYFDDFAAFTDGRNFYHFRPANPSNADWIRAQKAAQGSAASDGWNEFEPGVWIAYTCVSPVTGYQIGAAGSDTCAFAAASAAKPANNTAAVGACNSAVAGPADPTAIIFIAFGSTRAEVDEALEYARAEGDQRLYRAGRAAWERRLQDAKIPFATEPSIAASCRNDVITLLMCMDGKTGAIMQSPMTSPIMTLDFPRDGAYAGLALDYAGFPQLAAMHHHFFESAIRKTEASGCHAGSMPAALTYDGKPGLPALIFDAEAGAWWLASIWKHAESLPEVKRRIYCSSFWDSVQLAGDFLTQWTDNRDNQPLHSFSTKTWRDDKSPQNILAVYMGIDAALNIAHAAKGEMPADWTRRKRDLEIVLRLVFVDENGVWKGDDIIPYWYDQFAKTELPNWTNLIKNKMETGDTAADMLCDAALVSPADPALAVSVKQALLNEPVSVRLTTTAAAQHFLSAALIYGR